MVRYIISPQGAEGHAEKLTQLDLAGLELEELPPEIGKCPPLERLIVGKTQIQEKFKSYCSDGGCDQSWHRRLHRICQ